MLMKEFQASKNICPRRRDASTFFPRYSLNFQAVFLTFYAHFETNIKCFAGCSSSIKILIIKGLSKSERDQQLVETGNGSRF